MFLHLSVSHSVHTHPPQQTATAAEGTHPTGMHSCSMMRVLSHSKARRNGSNDILQMNFHFQIIYAQ